MAMLINGSVGHNKYNIFLIYKPKCRLVMRFICERQSDKSLCY